MVLVFLPSSLLPSLHISSPFPSHLPLSLSHSRSSPTTTDQKCDANTKANVNTDTDHNTRPP
jgi:hypothetical protein